MINLPQSDRQIISNFTAGDRLRKLILVDCVDIDPVTEFLHFSRLEMLCIEGGIMISIKDVDDAQRIPPEMLAHFGQLLPHLKSFSAVKTCLGHWSRLFECHRPSLTALQFSCVTLASQR